MSRCGTRAGTSTSPTRGRASAAGCGWACIPTRARAWINALLCGPGHADHRAQRLRGRAARRSRRRCAPTPSSSIQQADRTAADLPGHACAGSGQAYDDPAALLRGEAGRPVERGDGSGVDHRRARRTSTGSRPATRSRARCRGTVTVDGRDVRRSTRWPGSATIPGGCATGGHGLGVERTASRRRHPCARRRHPDPRRAADRHRLRAARRRGRSSNCRPSTARETFARQRLTASAPSSTLQPGGLVADRRHPSAHAPVLLTSPDGRVSQFPRAWATVTTADGRTGVGWVEWNRNL